MEPKRIIVMDDEPDICNILKFNLDKAGYITDVSNSAEDALTRDLSGYNLALLDVMLEGMSGFSLAEIMRKNPLTSSVPIIFITARDTEKDTLRGFGIGGDDYICKPFSVREVIARVNAVLNRTGRTADETAKQKEERGVIGFKSLAIDSARCEASVDGQKIELTRTELEILKLFLEHPSTVFSRDEILKRVWPEDVIVLGRTVDVNITRLRKKIGRYGRCIVTRHGYGYCFDGNEDSE